MDFLILAQTNLLQAQTAFESFEASYESFKSLLLGVDGWRYVFSLVALTVGLLLKKFLEVVVIRKLVNIFSKTAFRYDEMIVTALGKPLGAAVLVFCGYLAVISVATGMPDLDADWIDVINKAFLVALGTVAVWTAYRLVDVLASYLDDVAAGEDDTARGQFIPVIKQSLRVFTVIIGGLTILATLSVDIMALLGGLGIGGIAIALAAQDAVGNFIGTLSIFTDKPFKVGDWIQVGDKVDGNVEQIGFRSTKVRTWPKTLMSIPNKVLATEIVDNWSQMPKRRVKMTVGVTYSTTAEQMEELLKRMRTLLREDEGVEQSFYIVRFTDFGASSLDIFLYYFTRSIKWDEHLEVRERINLNVMRIIRDMELSIAFPTRSIHLESLPPGLNATPRETPSERDN